MNNKETLNEINKIFKSIFNHNSPFTIKQVMEKFAFDVKLPKPVYDSFTHQITWTHSINPTKFITQNNMSKYDSQHGWIQKRQELNSLDDILKYWNKINFTTTERLYDCINVHQSDPMYKCENAFRCTDCTDCKNVIFSDGCSDSESMLACQRSSCSSFCIRVDDSTNCLNSYNVICSNKVSNSIFIQDCNNLNECMFCSHISSKSYYISNMPFEKDEYYAIKQEIINWILSNVN